MATENDLVQNGQKADRIFYLSIPPSIFVPAAQNAANAASSKSGVSLPPRSSVVFCCTAATRGALARLSVVVISRGGAGAQRLMITTASCE